MPDRPLHHKNYPTLEFALGAIAGWINKYRNAAGFDDEISQCSPDEIRQIARELGVSVSELRVMSAKGPNAANLLGKMLTALSMEPDRLTKSDPAAMRDLQRVCLNCSCKDRCQHELTKHTAAENFRSFCPNAFTLDALSQSNHKPSH